MKQEPMVGTTGDIETTIEPLLQKIDSGELVYLHTQEILKSPPISSGQFAKYWKNCGIRGREVMTRKHPGIAGMLLVKANKEEWNHLFPILKREMLLNLSLGTGLQLLSGGGEDVIMDGNVWRINVTKEEPHLGPGEIAVNEQQLWKIIKLRGKKTRSGEVRPLGSEEAKQVIGNKSISPEVKTLAAKQLLWGTGPEIFTEMKRSLGISSAIEHVSDVIALVSKHKPAKNNIRSQEKEWEQRKRWWLGRWHSQEPIAKMIEVATHGNGRYKQKGYPEIKPPDTLSSWFADKYGHMVSDNDVTSFLRRGSLADKKRILENPHVKVSKMQLWRAILLEKNHHHIPIMAKHFEKRFGEITSPPSNHKGLVKYCLDTLSGRSHNLLLGDNTILEYLSEKDSMSGVECVIKRLEDRWGSPDLVFKELSALGNESVSRTLVRVYPDQVTMDHFHKSINLKQQGLTRDICEYTNLPVQKHLEEKFFYKEAVVLDRREEKAGREKGAEMQYDIFYAKGYKELGFESSKSLLESAQRMRDAYEAKAGVEEAERKVINPPNMEFDFE